MEFTTRQLEILSAVAKSEKDLYATELARIFEITQVAVSSSMSNLLRDGYLVEIAKEVGKTKYLRLTDKGIAAAVVYLGMDYEELVERHEYRWSEKPMLELFRKTISDKSTRTKMYQFSFKLALDNNLFDDAGHQILYPDKDNTRTFNQLSAERRRVFQLAKSAGEVQIMAEAGVTNTEFFNQQLASILNLLQHMTTKQIQVVARR